MSETPRLKRELRDTALGLEAAVAILDGEMPGWAEQFSADSEVIEVGRNAGKRVLKEATDALYKYVNSIQEPRDAR